MFNYLLKKTRESEKIPFFDVFLIFGRLDWLVKVNNHVVCM